MTRPGTRPYTEPGFFKQMIYLDYAATAPLRSSVAEAIERLCREALGNPSSLHSAGRRARFFLEDARERCASALGAKVEEIVFCSGATEADNLAILGALRHPDSGRNSLITSALEHAAVFQTTKVAEELKLCEVSWLQIGSSGRVVLESLEDELRQNQSSLVCVMAVNNEVGSRQPIPEIAALCREHGALLHVDAVQDPHWACELISEGLVDLLTLSGHKMGGLPGGLLFVRQGVPLAPQIYGGAQEDGRRAGTSEVLRAVSLAVALEATLAEPPELSLSARDLLETRLQNLPGAIRLGPTCAKMRANHISSWLFEGLLAEPILARLDMQGVCASSGSACSSHAVEPSRVVKAMGYAEQAMGLVRFSCGWKTSLEEVQRAADIIEETVLKMTMRVKT